MPLYIIMNIVLSWLFPKYLTLGGGGDGGNLFLNQQGEKTHISDYKKPETPKPTGPSAIG